MIETGHARDEARRVPIYSLYSETREPTAEMLRGLDVLVIDLQDVGTRIYTYIYTMANCLRAARKHGVKAIVCDRPNPIGGVAVEGPLLVAGFESFVGLYPIPMRHGMTIGELARLFNEHFGIGADLEVALMEGWRRDLYYDATGLPWVLPSPNIPTLESAVVYPGTVLFEGTNVSEGRGTTRPFELVGAPWVGAERFANAMNGLELSGVRFRPAVFEPTFHKHARHELRRLPDSRAGSRGLPPGRDRRRADGGISRRRPGSLPVARSPVPVRARQTAVRHPGRIVGRAGGDRARDAGPPDRAKLGGTGAPVQHRARTVPAVLEFESFAQRQVSRRTRSAKSHEGLCPSCRIVAFVP